jgi:hypothetical protein
MHFPFNAARLVRLAKDAATCCPNIPLQLSP